MSHMQTAPHTTDAVVENVSEVMETGDDVAAAQTMVSQVHQMLSSDPSLTAAAGVQATQEVSDRFEELGYISRLSIAFAIAYIDNVSGGDGVISKADINKARSHYLKDGQSTNPLATTLLGELNEQFINSGELAISDGGLTVPELQQLLADEKEKESEVEPEIETDNSLDPQPESESQLDPQPESESQLDPTLSSLENGAATQLFNDFTNDLARAKFSYNPEDPNLKRAYSMLAEVAKQPDLISRLNTMALLSPEFIETISLADSNYETVYEEQNEELRQLGDALPALVMDLHGTLDAPLEQAMNLMPEERQNEFVYTFGEYLNPLTPAWRRQEIAEAMRQDPLAQSSGLVVLLPMVDAAFARHQPVVDQVKEAYRAMEPYMVTSIVARLALARAYEISGAGEMAAATTAEAEEIMRSLVPQ